jgi:hypothetical protein
MAGGIGMKKQFPSIILRSISFSIIVLVAIFAPNRIKARGAGEVNCSTAPLVDSTLPIPAGIHREVSEALCLRDLYILTGEYHNLILTSFDRNDPEWVVFTVVMRPANMPENYESLLMFESQMLIGHLHNDRWIFAFDGDDLFQEFLDASPVTVFSDGAKSILRQKAGSVVSRLQGLPPSLGLKFPWKSGQTWKYSQGPHRWYIESVNSSLDFAPYHSIPSSEWEVRAAQTGVVKWKCVDDYQADIRMQHTGNYATAYLHLDKNSVSNLAENITVIQQGSKIGMLYNFQAAKKTTCGHGTGPHLHFYVGSISNNVFQFASITGSILSGWTLGSGGCFTQGGQNRCPGQSITSDNENVASTLTLGQVVNGEINPAGEQDTYYFNGSSNQEIIIEMNKASGTIDPFVTLYDQDGRYVNYDDDRGGYPNSRLVQRLSQSGSYRIVLRSYSVSQTGGYTIRVSSASSGTDTDDNRWLAHNQTLNGNINANNDEDVYYFSGMQDRIVSIHMDKSGGALDSYLELYDPNGSLVTVNDDGGGERNSWIVTILPRTGTYRLKARSYNRASSGAYNLRLRLVDANNYASGRGAASSSIEYAYYQPQNAFDNSMTTRWSSRFSDPQWVYVDLGQDRSFDSVILRWEAAYAKRYGIYVWTGSAWRNIFWTNNGRGGAALIRFPMTSGRFVMMYGVERGTPWGYSLWEFGVYNSTLALPPTVPPEDFSKDPDAVDSQTPLPLPEEDGGKDVIALFLGDGMTSQEVLALPDEYPGLSPTTGVDQTGNPSAVIEAIIPGHPGGGVVVFPDTTVIFEGNATDNDQAGDPGIIAYEWVSDKDGLISTDLTFTILGKTLSPGTHQISFRVKDNEGNWSDWDRLTIKVLTLMHLPFITQ